MLIVPPTLGSQETRKGLSSSSTMQLFVWMDGSDKFFRGVKGNTGRPRFERGRSDPAAAPTPGLRA
jgi:hypothetical protein